MSRLEKQGWRFGYESSLGTTWYKRGWVCKLARGGRMYFFRFGG